MASILFLPPLETLGPGLGAELRTKEMRRRCPAPLPDGQCTASEPAITNAVEDFIPRNACGPIPVKLVEPSVKLFFLSIRHWDRLRGEAVPELFEQVQPLCRG